MLITGAAVVLTMIEFEVPVIEAVTESVAVIVSLGPVFSVALKIPVPFVNDEFPGKTA